MKTKRLEILEKSLDKKENLFYEKIANHIKTVGEANGQPLNDKRNGRETINKWERQNDSIHKIGNSIEKTKEAIEREKNKIIGCESAKGMFPKPILELLENGTLVQWRKHPNFFFVKGVEKGRIVFEPKDGKVYYRYFSCILDKEQRKKFADIYTDLYKSINV